MPRTRLFSARLGPLERTKIKKLAQGLKLSEADVIRLAVYHLSDAFASGKVKLGDRDVELLRG